MLEQALYVFDKIGWNGMERNGDRSGGNPNRTKDSEDVENAYILVAGRGGGRGRGKC